MITDALSRRPRLLPPTLPLHRIRQSARGIFLTTAPLYLASHWRNGHSFPCLATILPTCPWCAGCEPRHHAYFPCLLKWDISNAHRVVLELPARTIPEISDFYGKVFTATRRSTRAPVTVTFDNAPPNAAAPPPHVDHRETLRTIAKVYALPDPAAYATELEWLVAIEARANDPDYTPAKKATPV
jgi:hypothetical protein